MAGASALAAVPLLGSRRGVASTSESDALRSERFLFVVTAYGGAGILDSFLPVIDSEVSTPQLANELIVYPESMVVRPPGSSLRCVRNLAADAPPTPPFRAYYELGDFLTRHGKDTCIVTVENTSVNHMVGQHRAITGDSINAGQTVMETLAQAYGESLTIPNCNLASGGFTHDGTAPETADFARTVLVSDARRFALSTHGYRGIPGAPSQDAIERARAVREQLDRAAAPASPSRLRDRYLELRAAVPTMEAQHLIDKLLLIGDDPAQDGKTDEELAALGLVRTPDFDALRTHLPDLSVDSLQAKAALAFLLAKHGVAATVTFGPTIMPRVKEGGEAVGTPVAFDFSHTGHTLAQNMNWSNMMGAVDGLISLLKNEPLGDGTMWDQSLVYIATDFGRGKARPAGATQFSYGSPHDLNNGAVLVSPRLRGDRVYGGVDPDTLLTYGFDPKTGDPVPGSRMNTGHLYSLVCQALDVDFPGRHDMSGLLR